MPWDMHRLTVAEWQLIVDGGKSDGDGTPGEMPEGWEQLPAEEV